MSDTQVRSPLARKLAIDLAIMTMVGVFLAVIGPFGSIEEPLPVRLVTWLLFSYIGYAIYSPMGYFVDRAHLALDLPKPPLWLVATLVATVPMTVVIYLVQFVPRLPPMPPLEEALTSYFYVFVVGGAVTVLFHFIGPRADEVRAEKNGTADQSETASEGQALSAPTNETNNPLFDQLPPELGSDVIALEMEDHYVRVHTALGSELVLMRLRDAMVHVAHIEGRQVHRSWWVARGAVEDVTREGRNVRLVLARKIEAPVSRAQVSELKDAGWI